ncbi:MAG: type IV pilus secretin PilQ [Acidobacteria bacterium]|nr:type IV pilus secretin PilQ [Acidobacteriota bacterium]
MTGTRGLALFLTVAAAGVFLNASGPVPGSNPPANVRLKAISARVTSSGASLVIEASEPVAYVATRPDPFTVVLEFRHATAEGVTNSVAAGRGVIAGVSVEGIDSMGTPSARVRVVLAQPVAHRVRSDRNNVVVDFDKPANPATAASLSRARSGDPMSALTEPPVVDPITALTASAPSSGPSAAAPVQAPAGPPAAPPPPAPMTPQATGTGGERKYTGNPVSLDFQGADLRAVLRTFAEISGLNIVIDPRVNGTVDVALKDVPWDQALDIILRANSLGYVVDGTIVRIAPLDALESEQKKISDLEKARAEAGQITTITQQLSYAKGDAIVALLKSASILSNRGQAFVDERTNTLIVTDLAERLTGVGDLIAKLDRAQPQVEIEARIVQTNKNYARALGIQWGFNGRVDPALGNTTNLTFPNSGSLGGRTGGTQGVATSPGGVQPTAVNLPVTGPTSAVGLAMGSINGAFNLDVALSALETSGNGRLLSTPRVTTQNNIPAEMTQGVQIPIQIVANNTVTVQFKDAALTLKVTPQITSANTVIMQIFLENASPDFSRAVNNIPPINTQRAVTQVLVSDGQTTVIGGIYVSQEQAATDRTPGLGQVPLLKWLFKRDTLNEQNTELLVFITPRIIKS